MSPGGEPARRLFVGLMLEPECAASLYHEARESLRRALGSDWALECDREDGRRVQEGAADLSPPRAEGRMRWRVRMARAHGLHLTLLFLGEVPADRVPELAAALSEGLAGLRRPRLRVTACGAFPDRGHARVLWAGVEEREPGGLGGVRERVLSAAESVGFDVRDERGRPFHPHVTLARVSREPGTRRILVPDEFFAPRACAEWDPEEVCLIESLTGGGGPATYEPLARFPIGAP